MTKNQAGFATEFHYILLAIFMYLLVIFTYLANINFIVSENIFLQSIVVSQTYTCNPLGDNYVPQSVNLSVLAFLCSIGEVGIITRSAATFLWIERIIIYFISYVSFCMISSQYPSTTVCRAKVGVPAFIYKKKHTPKNNIL